MKRVWFLSLFLLLFASVALSYAARPAMYYDPMGKGVTEGSILLYGLDVVNDVDGGFASLFQNGWLWDSQHVVASVYGYDGVNFFGEIGGGLAIDYPSTYVMHRAFTHGYSLNFLMLDNTLAVNAFFSRPSDYNDRTSGTYQSYSRSPSVLQMGGYLSYTPKNPLGASVKLHELSLSLMNIHGTEHYGEASVLYGMPELDGEVTNYYIAFYNPSDTEITYFYRLEVESDPAGSVRTTNDQPYEIVSVHKIESDGEKVVIRIDPKEMLVLSVSLTNADALKRITCDVTMRNRYIVMASTKNDFLSAFSDRGEYDDRVLYASYSTGHIEKKRFYVGTRSGMQNTAGRFHASFFGLNVEAELLMSSRFFSIANNVYEYTFQGETGGYVAAYGDWGELSFDSAAFYIPPGFTASFDGYTMVDANNEVVNYSDVFKFRDLTYEGKSILSRTYDGNHNRVPDIHEAFINLFAVPAFLAKGDDANNNTVVDGVEFSEQPLFPFATDRKGVNAKAEGELAMFTLRGMAYASGSAYRARTQR